jgi:hypothetical protein
MWKETMNTRLTLRTVANDMTYLRVVYLFINERNKTTSESRARMPIMKIQGRACGAPTHLRCNSLSSLPPHW